MKKYTILKNWHYSFFLFGRLFGWYCNKKTFNIKFKFSKECWWNPPRNQDDYDLNKYLVFYLETELWTPNYDYVSPVHEIVEFYNDKWGYHIKFRKDEYNTGTLYTIQNRSHNNQTTHYHIFENKNLAEQFRNQLLEYKESRLVPSTNKWLTYYMVNHRNPETMYTYISPPYEIVDEDSEKYYYIDNHNFSYNPEISGPYKNYMTKKTFGYSYAYYWKVFDTKEEATVFSEMLKNIHENHLNIHEGPTETIREFYDKLPELVVNSDRFQKLNSIL